LYRVLGSEVEHNTVLAGSQLDVLIRERTTSGSTVVRVVECKAYTGPVGVGVVRSFAALVDLLRTRGLADVATIVAANGYSAQARQAAAATNIELLELGDLEQRARTLNQDAPGLAVEIADAEASVPVAVIPQRLAFVVMPLAAELDDLYVLGIREVTESLGIVVERADELLHNESIVAVIQGKLSSCDIVIAEVSATNPNVYYEVGFAHALAKPVVLMSREGSEIPFDVAGFNHVRYTSILDLREKLKARLGAL